VRFDPAVISYQRLFEVFLDGHDPADKARSRQYRSAVFTHDRAQDQAARAALAAWSERTRRPARTAIEPAGPFFVAEDYHQKHLIQRRPELLAAFRRSYPRFDDFVASTAAARLNGYLGGYLSRAEIESDLAELGLGQPSAGASLDRALSH
jgi:hypothetical protein